MEDFYPEPDELLKARRFIEYKTRFIEPFFPKDRAVRIVDIGSGYGFFLDACRKIGYKHVEGVEVVEAFARYAREELNLSSIVSGDLFSFLESKDANSLDVITAFNIIEHVKKERVPGLLRLVHAKLRPGGIFIMEVPNADSPLGIHTYFSDLTHEFAYSRKLALRLLKTTGFDSVYVKYQPNLRNPLVRLAQRCLAKIIGLDYEAMFSGNLVLVAYK